MRWLGGLVIVILVSVFTLLFTSVGNSVLKPLIESKIKENVPVEVSLEAFELRFSSMKVKLLLATNSTIAVEGDYSLFSQSASIAYNVNIADLSMLKALTQQPLQGPLSTQGTLKGDKQMMTLKGDGKITKSRFNYDVDLEEFAPKHIMSTADLKLQELLNMLMQPHFADASITINADFPKLDLEQPVHSQGSVRVNVKEGVVDRSVMKKLYELKLPETPFKADVDIKLSDAKAEALLNALIAKDSKIALKSNIDLQSMAIKGNYDAAIKELAPFSAVAGMKLQGPIYAKGELSGDMKATALKGVAGLVATQVQYDLALKELKPQSVKAKVNAKLDELLYLVAQPQYAKADIAINADVPALDSNNMTGTVLTKISNGFVNTTLVKRDFNLSMPLTNFSADADTDIKSSVATTRSNVKSSIAAVQTQKTVFDLKTGNFSTDYKAVIDDLNQLYFLTQRKMKGSASMSGDVKQEGAHLEATAKSNVLGGELNAKLVDTVMTSTIKGFQTTALTDMLIMERVFSSTMNADLNYDTLSKQGVLNAELIEGKILPNQMTAMLQQMAKFDITKEIYKKTALKSTINDKVIYSDINMTSNLTDIKASGAMVDLKQNRVDAELDLMLKKTPVPITLKGDLNSPKIGINLNKMFEGEGKAKISEAIDKKLGDKLPEGAKNLLKGLFK